MANGENRSLVPYNPPQPPAQYQPIIYTMGGGKGGGNTALTLGIVALTLGLGGLALWWVFKGKAAGAGDITGELSFDMVSLQTTVNAGERVAVDLSITNDGEETVSPECEIDLQCTNCTTPVESNTWVPFGEIEPGETVTKEMGMVVPSAWTTGQEVYGRILCKGHHGTVLNEVIATVTGNNPGNPSTDKYVIGDDGICEGCGPDNQDIENGCIAVEENITVPGVAKGIVTLYNKTGVAHAVTCRLDIRPEGDWLHWWYGWCSGIPKVCSLTASTGPQTFELTAGNYASKYGGSIGAGDLFDAKVMIIGDNDPAWGSVDGGRQYRLFKLVANEVQAHVYITSRGLSGLAKRCITPGSTFSYTIDYDNRSNSAISADFILGFRDQGYGTYIEKSTTKSLNPGVGSVTITSQAPGWDGYVLDIRVLVRHKANIIMTSDQGDTDDTAGILSDIIYEGDQVAYVGDPNFTSVVTNNKLPADGRISNGSSIGITFNFHHIGPATSYKCGLFVKTNGGTTILSNGMKGFWIQGTVSAPEATAWTDVVKAITGTAILPSTLGVGSEMACYAGICEPNKTLDSAGMLLFAAASGVAFKRVS